MRGLLRKVRGALGISVTWAVLWALIFFILATVIGIVDPDSIDTGEEPIRIAGFAAVFGFVTGILFSALLATRERNKSIRNLSLGRVALWGYIGGAAFPLLAPADDRMALIFGPIGALLAVASVALAKRGARAAPSEEMQLPS